MPGKEENNQKDITNELNEAVYFKYTFDVQLNAKAAYIKAVLGSVLMHT